MSQASIFQCGTAARWLPRTLAAATIVGGMLLATRIYPGVAGSGWSYSRTLVMAVALMLALFVLRSGGSVRWAIEVSPETLAIRAGRHGRELPFEQITSVAYETPFVTRRQWLPSLVLVDRFGTAWRVPALLDNGGRFIDTLIENSGRDDLEMLIDAHGLRERMERVGPRLAVGYAVAAAIVLVCFWISTTGPAA